MSVDKRIDKLARDQKASIILEVHNFSINIETRELFVHGDIGDHDNDPGVDWRMSTNFIKNLRILESLNKDKMIFVHQYTSGGCFDAGIAMYDAIRFCQSPVTVIMWGIAASMGSIIPQAADRRIIASNCSFMIHEGVISIDGTHKQVISYVETSTSIQDKILDIYVDVCQYGQFFEEGEYSKEDIKTFLQNKMDKKEDWWLLPNEVVKYGFADGILGEEGFETLIDIRENWINEE